MGALWDLLSGYMASEGIKPAELARRTNVHETQLSGRIRYGPTDKVHPDTLRKLAKGTGIPLVDLIVASGMWTAEELRAAVVHRRPTDITNDELLALVRDRLLVVTGPPAAPEPEYTGDVEDSSPHPGHESSGPQPTGRRRPRMVSPANGESESVEDSARSARA